MTDKPTPGNAASGAEMRPPLNHPYRRIPYLLYGVEGDLSRAVVETGHLLDHITQAADAPGPVVREIEHLRRMLKQTRDQIENVREVADDWKAKIVNDL